jgi:rubrerythrin
MGRNLSYISVYCVEAHHVLQKDIGGRDVLQVIRRRLEPFPELNKVSEEVDVWIDYLGSKYSIDGGLTKADSEKLRADAEKWCDLIDSALSEGERNEEKIIREIVKIRCSHCGTLSDEIQDRCPNCGGPLH